MILSPKDRRELESLISTFGRERFTISDLWRKWIGRHYFPDHQFKETYERQLAHWPFIEEATGPRGGKGWRLTEDAHAFIEGRKREAQAVKRLIREKNKRAEHHASALTSRFGSTIMDRQDLRVTVLWPDPYLRPRLMGGFPAHFREMRFYDALAQWHHRRRFRITTVCPIEPRLTCQWRHARRAAKIIAEADELFRREIEDATKHFEQRLGALPRMTEAQP